MSIIYLDYNATTPIDPRIAEAMLPYIHDHFGNPSSIHILGIKAREAVEKARTQVADFLRCNRNEIIFTSGGTESNNYAIKGVAYANRHKGNHIITSVIEHSAVLKVCRYLEEQGFSITYLPVNKYGMIDPSQIKQSITPQTILITIMHANNEVGTIEPIEEMAEIARSSGILIHTDCAQSVGKIPVFLDELNVDLLSVAGHKLYAPKGVGALFVRNDVKLEKFMHGASHEMNRRAGTENVIGIVGLGKACDLIAGNIHDSQIHMRRMRDRLEAGLKGRINDIRINGHPEKRLPNTLSVGFKGIEANNILLEMDGIAASAGAACHSDSVRISHVLEAMQTPLEYAKGTIRFSTGRFTTEDEIDQALEEIVRVVNTPIRPFPDGYLP